MKRVFILCIILAMLLLVGCRTKSAVMEPSGAIDLSTPVVVTDPGAGQPPAAAGTMAEPGGSPQGMGNGEPGAQSTQVQLLVGLLGLEGTDLALNATQATSILPALTVLQDETTNGPVTPEKLIEMDSYIRSILSTEQIAAITAMDLSQEKMVAILEPYGITLNPQMGGGNDGPQGTSLSGAQGAMPQGTPPAGQTNLAGGTPPGGGNGVPQGGGRGGGGSGINALPTGLLDALIEVLQTRAAS